MSSVKRRTGTILCSRNIRSLPRIETMSLSLISIKAPLKPTCITTSRFVNTNVSSSKSLSFDSRPTSLPQLTTSSWRLKNSSRSTWQEMRRSTPHAYHTSTSSSTNSSQSLKPRTRTSALRTRLLPGIKSASKPLKKSKPATQIRSLASSRSELVS